MADITLSYKGATISEISASGTKTLKTAGKYCEDDITITFSGGSVTQDSSIYSFRQSTHNANLMRLKKIIGGSVAWNQMCGNGNFRNANGWGSNGVNYSTLSVSDNIGTFTAKSLINSSTYAMYYMKVQDGLLLQNGHVILAMTDVNPSRGTTLGFMYSGVATNSRSMDVPANTWTRFSSVVKMTANNNNLVYYFNRSSTLLEGDTVKFKNVNALDLTVMFGSTIADYIYSLEQANAGVGVAWFRNLFTKDYYPFDAWSIVSVKPSARKAISPDVNSYAIYPFDSTIELRGVLKLDASNNLYYDGDEYTPNGNIKRNYGTRAYQSGDESDSSVLTDGTNTIYKLSTPTTESATPYIELQATFPDGTEEFVDARTVPMPVSQDAEYFINENS